MSSTWKIIGFSIILLLLSAAAYVGYQSYITYKQPHFRALRAVPASCMAFFETDDINEVSYPVLHADFWEAFGTIPNIKQAEDQYLLLDSLIRYQHTINEILENNSVIWALIPFKTNDLSSLLIIEVPADYAASYIREFIEESNGRQSIVMHTPYRDASVFTVNLPKAEKLFYFTVFRGLFIAGLKREIIELSVDELYNQNPLSAHASFHQVKSTAGKNVALNMYVQFPVFMSYLSSKLNPALKELLERTQGFGDWSETDLLLHPDNLLLNGYSVSPDSSTAGLSLFKQAPASIHIPDILPFNVDWMLDYALNDMQHYLELRVRDPVFKDEINRWQKQFKDAYAVDMNRDFIGQLSGECAVAKIGSTESSPGKMVVILQTKDILGAVLKLGKIGDAINRKSRRKAFQSSFQEFTIRALNTDHLFQAVFGKAFPNFSTNYYITIKNYLVFADNPQTLIYLLKQYYARNTLSENANYKEFSNNISDKSNIFLYANLQRTFRQIPLLFDPSLRPEVNQYIQAFGNFEAVALQFSYINQMFYTNIFLKYNPDYQEAAPDNWESKLGSTVSGKPNLLPNHRSGKLNVLVTDDKHTLYLLDHVGNIQWTKDLSMPVLGDIQAIDYYGNGKFQYLFNTANFIYLIDINGHDVEDYPHALPATATSPLAVFDYNNDKDYRILIGLSDNRIYNYDKHGKQVDGWNKIISRSEVNQPVEHLVDRGKDYLFVTDKDGRVLICNRRGEERIHLKDPLLRAEHSIFYVNQTNNKGRFITTNQKGQLVYVSDKGAVQTSSFGTFSKDHFFFYRDADHKGSLDFIFIDGNNLKVFDRFKKIIFEQEFPEVISSKPVLYQSGGKLIMGILLPVSGKIRLFSTHGRLFENSIIKGNIPFSIGSIQGDLKLNLISGMDQRVINYSLSSSD